MSEFKTSLFRERFVIENTEDNEEEPLIVLGNRIALPFQARGGTFAESFVVRARNMHTALRMGAHMARHFQEYGSLVGNRAFDWKKAYESIIKGFEKRWNSRHWVVVYHKGRKVFEDGAIEHHKFLDVIEQCAVRNTQDYEATIEIAKEAFKQAGRQVQIHHDVNVALLVNIKEGEARCGVIVRVPNRTTTFNFTVEPEDDKPVKISACLSASAAFLEGIQMSFKIGMARQRLHYELIEPGSDESRSSKEASQKLGRLNNTISQFENTHTVTYRPDRPNFGEMVTEAENFAEKILEKDIQAKIAAGGFEGDEWVT